MSDIRLYLIDATAFCYRAFYALGGLATSFGQPTNAIYGFTNMLNKILKEKSPAYLGVCFDVSRDTVRLKKFAEYKINRPPMPEGLVAQLPFIRQIISAYGLTIFQKQGFEADDLLATLSKKAKDKGLAVTIISSDKDILQLVDENTLVYSPYKDAGTTYDRQGVFQRFGIEPAQIPDMLALMGDDVDNIPGVEGIGEKTAVELIKRFGSIEALFADINAIQQDKLKATLKANIDKIKLNKELALLDQGLDLDFDPDTLKVGPADYKELFRLFKYFEFKKFIQNLPVSEGPEQEGPCPKVTDAQLKNLIGPQDELFVHAQEKQMLFSARGKIFCLDNLGAHAVDVLSSPEVRKAGHDLKKIKVALAKDGIALNGLYFDVMLAAYILNPSKASYALEEISWDYLPDAAAMQNISAQKAMDLIVKLKPALEQQLQEKNLFNLFKDVEIPLAEVLAEMELSGIKLDVDLLKDLSRQLESRLAQLIDDIYQMSGCQFNINSPKQLRQVLFERLQLKVVKRTKTGPSTDEEVLRFLAKSHKLPELLLEYRQLTKLKSTYVDVLPALVDPKTGRLHTCFNQAATETGRLSSTNPNLQNIPVKTDIGRKIRQAIIAFSPDSWLLSYDYSQIELRILAHISKDESLISAFKEDKDIHKITASLIYGLEEKDVTGQMREVAKKVNFGIVYGLTAYGLARDLGISNAEADNFIAAYFLRYPGVKVYIEDQIQKARDDGFVSTILGRRRYIPDINHKNPAIRELAQRQAVNTPIQGSASDLIKLAMIEIGRQLKQADSRAKMIMQIHDELVFDVPEKELAQNMELVKDRMENVLKLEVPIRVSIKKGKNWLETEEVK